METIPLFCRGRGLFFLADCPRPGSTALPPLSTASTRTQSAPKGPDNSRKHGLSTQSAKSKAEKLTGIAKCKASRRECVASATVVHRPGSALLARERSRAINLVRWVKNLEISP
jgi:hypothetical protein